MLWKSLERYRDVGLLILRLGFGLGFIFYHGHGKLTGGPERWVKLGANMELLGVDFWPAFWGFMIAMAETVFALFIAVGFLFRPSLMILGFGMFVAWLFHVTSGDGNPGNAFKNFFVAAGLILTGPGKYSVDEWLLRRRKD